MEKEKTKNSHLEKDYVELTNYIKQCMKSPNELYSLYLFRNNNSITYGRFENGMGTDLNTIEMNNNEDLKRIYDVLKTEFKEDFNERFKHTFSGEWSLHPIIGENVVINIDSDNSYDLNWFYEEFCKKEKNSSKKKK